MLGPLKHAVLALLALTAAYLLVSRGSPVPVGSYVDRRQGFSLLPPAHWRVLIPARLSGGEEAVLLLIGPGVGGRGSSSIQVTAAPGDWAGLEHADPSAVAGPIQADIERTFGRLTQESASWRNVDGLRALRLSGLLQPRADPAIVRLTEVVVPGGGRRFLLTFIGSPDPASADDRAFEDLLASFRVLARPVPI